VVKRDECHRVVCLPSGMWLIMVNLQQEGKRRRTSQYQTVHSFLFWWWLCSGYSTTTYLRPVLSEEEKKRRLGWRKGRRPCANLLPRYSLLLATSFAWAVCCYCGRRTRYALTTCTCRCPALNALLVPGHNCSRRLATVAGAAWRRDDRCCRRRRRLQRLQ